MPCEETSRRVGSRGAYLMRHHPDPNVRSVAASAVTQRPDHTPSPPNVCPTCGQHVVSQQPAPPRNYFEELFWAGLSSRSNHLAEFLRRGGR